MVKVIAFDFDDTLYSGCDIAPWINFCKQAIKDILQDNIKKNKKCIEQFLLEDNFSDKNIIYFLRSFGLTEGDWFNYVKNHEVVGESFDMCQIVPNIELEQFAKKYVLYIVSNSTKTAITRNSKKMGINLSLFKEIITNPYQLDNDSKAYLYQTIIKKENIASNELFVVGNSYNTDIKPALEIGANGQVVKNASFVFNDIIISKR